MRKLVLLLQLLLMFLFSCGNQGGLNDRECQDNINKIKEISDKINKDYKDISEEVYNLAKFTESLYLNKDKYKPRNINIYKLSKEGVFYKTVDDGGAAVYVSSFLPISDNKKNIVYFTEPLDSVLKEIIFKYRNRGDSAIVQAYYNDKNSYNRIYPFIDVLLQYEPDMEIPSFNFYYLADEKQNPGKKAVWVNEPYVDPAGRGWMVSAIAPVYFNNELQGVVGLDVTVRTIIDKYLSASNDLLISDKNGVLVAADEYITNLLNFNPLKDHKYFETVKSDTYRPDDYNLIKHKNKELRMLFEKIIKNGSVYEFIKYENSNLHIFSEKIKELDWYVLKVVRE